MPSLPCICGAALEPSRLLEVEVKVCAEVDAPKPEREVSRSQSRPAPVAFGRLVLAKLFKNLALLPLPITMHGTVEVAVEVLQRFASTLLDSADDDLLVFMGEVAFDVGVVDWLKRFESTSDVGRVDRVCKLCSIDTSVGKEVVRTSISGLCGTGSKIFETSFSTLILDLIKTKLDLRQVRAAEMVCELSDCCKSSDSD